jgi:hypothetical protein
VGHAHATCAPTSVRRALSNWVSRQSETAAPSPDRERSAGSRNRSSIAGANDACVRHGPSTTHGQARRGQRAMAVGSPAQVDDASTGVVQHVPRDFFLVRRQRWWHRRDLSVEHRRSRHCVGRAPSGARGTPGSIAQRGRSIGLVGLVMGDWCRGGGIACNHASAGQTTRQSVGRFSVQKPRKVPEASSGTLGQ